LTSYSLRRLSLKIYRIKINFKAHVCHEMCHNEEMMGIGCLNLLFLLRRHRLTLVTNEKYVAQPG